MLCSIFLWKNGKTPPALPGMYGAKGGRHAAGTVGRAGCVNTGRRVGDGIGTPGVQFAGQPLVGEDVDGGTGKDPSGPRGLLPRGGGHRHFGELSGERAGLFGTRLFRGAGTGMDSQLGTAAAGGRRGILAGRGQGGRTATAGRPRRTSPRFMSGASRCTGKNNKERKGLQPWAESFLDAHLPMGRPGSGTMPKRKSAEML